MGLKNSVAVGEESVPEMEEARWEYEAVQYNVTQFLFRPLNDLWMPHLEIVSNYGSSQVVLFYDRIVYKFSRERYCAHCFSVLENNTFYPYCDACLREKELYFLICYEKGVGLGSGYCDYTNPPCQSQFCANYCKSGFSVYLTLLNEKKVKVGVTKRENVFYKLLEEGAPFGMHFLLGADSLGDALGMKEAMLKQPGWRKYLLFEDKLAACRTQFKQEVDSPDFSSIAQRVQEGANVKLDQWYDLREFALNIPDRLDYQVRTPQELKGVLMGFFGAIGFFQEEGRVFAFDMKSLPGKILENVIG